MNDTQRQQIENRKYCSHKCYVRDRFGGNYERDANE